MASSEGRPRGRGEGWPDAKGECWELFAVWAESDLSRCAWLFLSPLPRKIGVDKRSIKDKLCTAIFWGRGKGEGASRGYPAETIVTQNTCFSRVMLTPHKRLLPAAFPPHPTPLRTFCGGIEEFRHLLTPKALYSEAQGQRSRAAAERHPGYVFYIHPLRRRRYTRVRRRAHFCGTLSAYGFCGQSTQGARPTRLRRVARDPGLWSATASR